MEIIEREHIDGISYMESIADALREEGRRQEREKTQQIEAELRKELQQNKTVLQEEKKKEIALHKEHQKEVTSLRKVAKENEERKNIFIVKQLLQKKMSIEFIRETTGLTRKRIVEIRKNMG